MSASIKGRIARLEKSKRKPRVFVLIDDGATDLAAEEKRLREMEGMRESDLCVIIRKFSERRCR